MPFHKFKDIDSRELFPGFHGRVIHGEQMTVIYWEIESGAVLPEHSHPEEQISTILSGKFEMTIAGETRQLETKEIAVVPSNAVHSGRALSACTILDAFYPSRKQISKLEK